MAVQCHSSVLHPGVNTFSAAGAIHTTKVCSAIAMIMSHILISGGYMLLVAIIFQMTCIVLFGGSGYNPPLEIPKYRPGNLQSKYLSNKPTFEATRHQLKYSN